MSQMNEKASKFKSFISQIGIKQTEGLESGAIEEIVIQREQGVWNFHLSFDSVLPFESYLVLDTTIKDTMKNLQGVSQVQVYYQYQNQAIDAKNLEKYYTYFFEDASLVKRTVLVCEERNMKFGVNKIIAYVANEEEKECFYPLYDFVLSFFKQAGIDFPIKLEFEISSFETPIQDYILNNIKKTDQEVLQAYQDAKKQEKISKETTKEVGFKKRPGGRKNIDSAPVALSVIPSSDVEIIEYSQQHGTSDFVIEGRVLMSNIKSVRGGYKIYEATVTDDTDSILVKSFLNKNNMEKDEIFFTKEACANKRVRIFGTVNYDRFARDVVLSIKDIQSLGDYTESKRKDTAEQKRVELHAHTKMSAQDGIMDVEEYVKRAKEFGHSALAVTDHYNIHVLPDFNQAAKKHGLKPIYGVEGAFLDEVNFKIALTDDAFALENATYVAYDLETTGLMAKYNEIIEIAAVKIHKGQIIDEFSSFVKPKRSISEKITNITSITNDDVRLAPTIDKVLPEFLSFISGCVLVAHNATFDNAYLYENMRRLGLFSKPFPTIDTLQLSRVAYGTKLKRFNLKAVAKYFDVDLEQHHRAIYDAKTTGYIFLKMLRDLLERGITTYEEINLIIDTEEVFSYTFPTHITILSKNKKGQKNLNKIISDSHTVHFAKEPIILKSFLEKHRENLLIGSGCSNGAVFTAAMNQSKEELEEIMQFYDYIEVFPPSAYEHLVEDSGEEITREYIKDIITTIISVAKASKKIVVATGDVHHLEEEDVKYRDIFVKSPLLGNGRHDLVNIDNIPSLYFKTTNEMLSDFSFLPEDLRLEIVITNTNLIAEQIETYDIFPKELFAPRDNFLAHQGIPSFKDAVRDMTFHNAKEKYGAILPKLVEDRIQKELHSIISHNYASIYYISYLLVDKSRSDGYVVGSRGSVGSSLVATLMNITEVNPLPPHYVCPKCHFSVFKMTPDEKKHYKQTSDQEMFIEAMEKVDTGYDLPDAKCPSCNHLLDKNGVDIPFETFLGFEGDKVPDIDLNFSGDYQNKAHEFCRELFGVDNAFRAGTISTIAEKTAYGYVKGYYERKGLEARQAEINRIAKQIEGVKRSTGQHPGGIIVIPDEIEYTDIIPVQYPADDTSSPWRTSHYDYHKFENNLLKLDILGHDDPTMIRHLMDFVEAFPDEFPFQTPEEIPITDSKVLKVFTGVEVLGVNPNQVFGEVIGTTGLPEFGTQLTKRMLVDIRPSTISDLLKVSGLSHGTDVWEGNSRDLLLGLKDGVSPIPFKELIGCRDDIMVYLMSRGLSSKISFQIMESVRKGKGLSASQEKEMIKHQIPKWYIDSCKMIKYMFPKAHATAYVIMALRIAWFKVHKPLYYYAAYFSRRANAFDIVALVGGERAINKRLLELKDKQERKTATNKDIDTFQALLLALEMVARGFSFKQINIKTSDWRDFLVDKESNSLLIPFSAMDSLGASTAQSVVEAREQEAFTSKRDVITRTKINATVFEKLDALGVFKDLPDDDQMDLFA